MLNKTPADKSVFKYAMRLTDARSHGLLRCIVFEGDESRLILSLSSYEISFLIPIILHVSREN